MEERVVERLDLGGVNAWLVKGRPDGCCLIPADIW